MDDVSSVSVSAYNTFAVKTNGELWAWGDNRFGQVGDGSRTYINNDFNVKNLVTDSFVQKSSLVNNNKDKPEKIMNDTASVYAGDNYCVAIKTNGELWAWGDNWHGKLGDGSKTLIEYREMRESIPDFINLKTNAITYHMIRYIKPIIISQGNKDMPVKIMDGAAQAYTGSNYTLTIKSNGELWAWGDNSEGQFGSKSKPESLVPTKIMEDVAHISSSNNSKYIIKTSGELWVWGDNSRGTLGYDSHPFGKPSTPFKITEGVLLRGIVDKKP